ncbi:Ger(x)C family spore germination protein [Candidatus Desulforudis audaxviator]|uniref:Ger(x)C family spore germination protein n=1 Tax=Candidatus Desulforudis audaxviator TaxID=471827 RepID=UPI0009FF03C0|nr:Ger(x)C family spore germination protein [Candidatus Desulforudis audaxviator]
MAVLILAVLCLPGCWDYRELDETTWVTAVGVDRGRENTLTVTLQIAVAANIAGGGDGRGGAGAGETVLVTSMEAPSLLSALEFAHAWIDRHVDLSHTKVIIVGRELAETDFAATVAPLVRFPQFRPTIRVLVANGRAEAVLREAAPVLEASPGKFWELQVGGWDVTEFIPRADFHQIYIDMSSPGAAGLVGLVAVRRREEGPADPSHKAKGSHMAGTIPRRGGPGIEMMGAAVIHGGRMVGVLNGDETGIGKMVRGTFREMIKTVRDPLHPGRFIVVRVFPREPPAVQVRIGDDGTPRVSVRVPLEGDILAIQSGEHYERPERTRQVEQAVKESLMTDARATLDKAQNEFGADFFALGYHAKRLFPTWQAWEAFAWDEKFPDAEISIDFDFRVRRIGLLRETVPWR